MPQEDDDAPKVHEAQEVLSFSIPADGDSSKLLEPREESFHLPAPTIATKRSAILLSEARCPNPAAQRCDQLDSALTLETLGQRPAVECFVANQLSRELFDEGGVERLLDEGAVVLGARRDASGERKTSAVCKRHDLCRLAGTTSTDTGPPFLAPA